MSEYLTCRSDNGCGLHFTNFAQLLSLRIGGKTGQKFNNFPKEVAVNAFFSTLIIVIRYQKPML